MKKNVKTPKLDIPEWSAPILGYQYALKSDALSGVVYGATSTDPGAVSVSFRPNQYRRQWCVYMSVYVYVDNNKAASCISAYGWGFTQSEAIEEFETRVSKAIRPLIKACNLTI